MEVGRHKLGSSPVVFCLTGPPASSEGGANAVTTTPGGSPFTYLTQPWIGKSFICYLFNPLFMGHLWHAHSLLGFQTLLNAYFYAKMLFSCRLNALPFHTIVSKYTSCLNANVCTLTLFCLVNFFCNNHLPWIEHSMSDRQRKEPVDMRRTRNKYCRYALPAEGRPRACFGYAGCWEAFKCVVSPLPFSLGFLFMKFNSVHSQKKHV